MTSTTRRRVLLTAGAAGCSTLLGWFAWRRYHLAEVPDEATRVLFAQTLVTATGQPFPMSELRGRTVVLNFWATWCPPCVDEMPELSALHQEIARNSATVIGIGIDSAVKIRQFAQSGRFAYPLLVGDASGEELARIFGDDSSALPFTVVINAAGRVVYRRLGRIQLQRLRQAVFDAIEHRAT